nr:nucleotide exchange factor GrpE [Bacteroidales bacterium]
SMRSTDDCNAVKAGLELIYSKINDFLKQNAVKEIEAMNEPFNSDFHEAVTTVPVEDDKLKGLIIDVTQKGYTLNDKVIRYPKVVVGE